MLADAPPTPKPTVFYKTNQGEIYLSDALDVLKEKKAESVDPIMIARLLSLDVKRLQVETEAELAAFTPALLAKAFRGEL